MVNTNTEIEKETGMELPIVLSEKSEIVFCGRRGARRGVGNFRGEGMVFAENTYRKIGHAALVGGTKEGVTESEEMAAAELERPQMETLRPLVKPGLPALAFEEAAKVHFRIKCHHTEHGIGRKEVVIQLFQREKRLHKAAI